MKIHILLFLLPLFIITQKPSDHAGMYGSGTEFENDFESQLNNIISNYPSRFDSLKSSKNALKDEWDCKLKLVGSSKTLIERSFGYNSFLALFGLSDKYDENKAVNQYNNLIRDVRSAKFSCCSFKELQDEDFILWKVIDPKPGFENLGIQISFVMIVGYHDDKQYAVQLKVYNTSVD